MSRVKDSLIAAFKTLPEKPSDSAKSTAKKNYSQKVSEVVAVCFAEEFRQRGMATARPGLPGEVGVSGAERRMSGGIGAKKVDVTWATEESGLVLAVSIKSVNFRDGTTKNFQKNLTNRRGDMLFESVTLHRRFPYGVLGGFLFLDQDAANDGSKYRRNTFLNAHHRLKLFTGRTDPTGRDEQYELLYIALADTNTFSPSSRFYLAGDPDNEVPLEDAFTALVRAVAERNMDFYEEDEGILHKFGRPPAKPAKAKKSGAATAAATTEDTVDLFPQDETTLDELAGDDGTDDGDEE